MNLADARLPPGFSATVFASDLRSPRGMVVVPGGDILVIERGEGARITALWDDNGDGVSTLSERAVLSNCCELNHGIAVHGGYIFASSPEQVWRWPYTNGQRTALGTPTLVVDNIYGGSDLTSLGAPGGHKTRTLAIDASGRLFISIGSFGNVDEDDSRSLIRYVDGLASNASNTSLPVDFRLSPIWARGLRNEVGIGLDSAGVLWGVENGADWLSREDLGGDIHKVLHV